MNDATQFFNTTAGGGYEIERSLRFNSSDSAYLSRTPSVAGNRKTWTWAGWVKLTNVYSGWTVLFDAFDGATTPELNYLKVSFFGNQLNVSTDFTNYRRSTAIYRDLSAWMHVVCAFDTTQITPDDRIKLYVNGSEITSFAIKTNPTLDSEHGINRAVEHRLGRDRSIGFSNFYLADIHFIDGQALDPTSFGEFDANGVWQPIAYAGSYGTNGFHLPFSDNSTAAALGTDTSGNGNDWTVNNITASSTTSTGPWLSGFRTGGPQASWNSSTPITTLQSGSSLYTAGNTNGLRIDTQALGLYNLTVSYVSGNSMQIHSSDDPAVFSQTTHSTGSTAAIAINSLGTSTYAFKRYIGFEGSGSGNTTIQITGTVGDSSATDSLVDTPTNYGTDTGAGGEVRGNYCTWDPLSMRRVGSMQIVDGNLIFGDLGTSSRYGSALGTIAVSSGKWYWEILLNSGTGPDSNTYIGIVPVEQVNTNTSANVFNTNSAALSLRTINPQPTAYRGDNTSTAYGTQVLIGDTIGIALDVDNLTVEFYKNGVSMGTFPYALASGYTWIPFVTDWSNNIPVSEFILNAGQRPFAYTAPSGFKALCTTNLPEPLVAKPSEVMDVKLYTGNGSTQTISGLGFSPDLVWMKPRSAVNDHVLCDIIRGPGVRLFSNSTSAELTAATSLTSFDSGGFSLGSHSSVNTSSVTYVAWTWDAGSSTVTNTQGSITSQVRANPSAGFSIVTYTGNGTSGATIGHGLGVAPDLVIAKRRSSANDWWVYHRSLGGTKYLTLNLTNAAGTANTIWNDTNPSSTVVTLGGGESNTNTATYVAYCFAPVAGYSSAFSYSGTGTTSGSFVYLGFRPRFLIIKKTNAAGSWALIDTARSAYNISAGALFAESANAEDARGFLDILSNGFKLTSTLGDVNASGANYIGYAFAEHPFQYARAR